MTPYLGCIADDFTGATDLADMLAQNGMKTTLTLGTPQSQMGADYDAIVIALKSRMMKADDAVSESLDALNYLQAAGCETFYFKYCSTFDSTPEGNIGPVTDALMTALGESFTIACPAFPKNGRTIYKGNLFVGDVPLDESGMRNHPLTPMRDANLSRVLQNQTSRKVGIVPIEVVWEGVETLRRRFVELRKEGVEIAIVDALEDEDLHVLASASNGLRLLTAGSGLAEGVAINLAARRSLGGSAATQLFKVIPGKRAILSGSCSVATQAQVDAFVTRGMPSFVVDPMRIAAGEPVVEEALEYLEANLDEGPVLIYATANSEAVTSVQASLGVQQAGQFIEETFALLAKGLVQLGVTQIVVAGGETSGAVVNALKVNQLQIGPQIVPGVPWTCSTGKVPLNLALKSGNFGDRNLFQQAWDKLDCLN